MSALQIKSAFAAQIYLRSMQPDIDKEPMLPSSSHSASTSKLKSQKLSTAPMTLLSSASRAAEITRGRRACGLGRLRVHDGAGLVFDFLLRLLDGRLGRRGLLPRLRAERGRRHRRECRLAAAAAIRHQSFLGRDDVAGPQGRIGLHVKGGQPERVLAVAAAIGDQVLAIEERRINGISSRRLVQTPRCHF